MGEKNDHFQDRSGFAKESKRFRKHYASFDNDLEKLLADLSDNPKLGTDLGNGIRKIRMQVASKG